jgi:hypothetical protein
MARFGLQFLVIIILASLLELILPWWSVSIAAVTGGYFFRSNANFFAGFMAVFILWVSAALIIDLSSVAPLAQRVAAIFTVPKPALFAMTGVLGGLVGGFAAATGASLRKEKRKLKYY